MGQRAESKGSGRHGRLTEGHGEVVIPFVRIKPREKGGAFYEHKLLALGFHRKYELGYSRTLLPQTILCSKILDTGVYPASLRPHDYLKLTRWQYDLDLSVQKNMWATQRHNEEILDQAYRTSKDVFLIFGVNKSGEFYGYARLALTFVVLLIRAQFFTGWQGQS